MTVELFHSKSGNLHAIKIHDIFICTHDFQTYNFHPPMHLPPDHLRENDYTNALQKWKYVIQSDTHSIEYTNCALTWVPTNPVVGVHKINFRSATIKFIWHMAIGFDCILHTNKLSTRGSRICMLVADDLPDLDFFFRVFDRLSIKGQGDYFDTRLIDVIVFDSMSTVKCFEVQAEIIYKEINKQNTIPPHQRFITIAYHGQPPPKISPPIGT